LFASQVTARMMSTKMTEAIRLRSSFGPVPMAKPRRTTNTVAMPSKVATTKEPR
jgi:hypothetical protein